MKQISIVGDKKTAQQIADASMSFNGAKSGVTAPRVFSYFQTSRRLKTCILPRLKKEFPFLGKRSVTEGDFFEFCGREGITIVTNPAISTGVYVLFGSESFIFLGSQLTGPKLRYVMFHEVAHYLFHPPSQTANGPRFDQATRDRYHVEAEIVTALLNMGN